MAKWTYKMGEGHSANDNFSYRVSGIAVFTRNTVIGARFQQSNCHITSTQIEFILPLLQLDFFSP